MSRQKPRPWRRWSATRLVAFAVAQVLVAPAAPAAPRKASKKAEVIQLEESETEVEHEPVTEQRLNTPVPIYAELSSGAEEVTGRLHYRSSEQHGWKSVSMDRMGDGFGAEIPCAALKKATTIRYYVKFKDSEGTSLASAGSREEPFTITISEEPVDDPPHFPGRRPPKRCAQAEAEPECESGDEPGCEAETTPAPRAPSGPPAVWLSLGLAQDVALVSGDQVCTRQSQLQGGFACFRESGTQYHGTPQPGMGGQLGSGPVFATTRVYLASDIRLSGVLTLGLRVGYAIAGQGLRPDGGKSFFPMHAELRGQYWLSDRAFPDALSGFVFVSGGVAQIDGRKNARVVEDRSVPPPPTQLDNPDEQTLDAYKKMGLSFVALGAGVFLPFAEQHGVLCDLKAMALFPDTGAAVELELGYALGL